MNPSVRIFFCLFCGALSAAQDFIQPAAGRFGHQIPERPEVQEPAAVLQEKQSFHEPLSWRFPDPPAEEEPRFPPDFELKAPEAADSVSAICGENSIRVEAKKDLLGIGKPVLAADVTLGGCPATGEDPEAQVLVFESELHGCGSQLLMSEDSFIYAFTLIYTPSPLGNSQIIRTRGVTVSIQCHYQRKHDVSSGPLKPTWSPFSLTKASEESLYFSVKLMTGECLSRCLFDSQLTGSSSQFLPRSQDDRLQFEVEAFRFQQDDSGMIYITCSVRATAAAAAVDATNKACSFSNGWREASGSHQVCACCDTDCGTGSQSHLTGTGAQWEQETAVGPITVKERPL
uniref:zona pellucida sperm-binding protein 3-like n=1 Tax=Epinephelus lanceolatus TaxID=310571 RepID=UPI001446CB9C|nr:zona pellucida sperm-binding protein 3-like [Epinephelus lanceolatus]